MIVSSKEINLYLQDKKVSFDESFIQDQLSSKGLMHVLAKSSILVATTIDELQQFVKECTCHKRIILFYPVDEKNIPKDFWSFHKVVIYLEWKDSVLHAMVLDSTPYSVNYDFTFDVIQQVHKNIIRWNIHWTIYNDTLLHVQSDFWSCGTHALHIALSIEKMDDFLESLDILYSEDNGIYCKVPYCIAECADNTKAQTILVDYLKKESLSQHYKMYGVDFINRETKRYISLL